MLSTGAALALSLPACGGKALAPRAGTDAAVDQPAAEVIPDAGEPDLGVAEAPGDVPTAAEASVDAPAVVDAPDGGADGPAPIDGGRVAYRAIAVVTGEVHSCALLDDHRVKCWGNNSYGELGCGDGQTRGRSPSEMGDALPTIDLGTGRTALEIAASRYATCAILDDHSLRCWGWAALSGTAATGNIGEAPGEMGDHLVAANFEGRRAVHLAMGEYNACASMDDDTIWCWREGETPFQHAGLTPKKVKALGPSGGGVIALYDDGTLSPSLPGGVVPLPLPPGKKAVAVAGSLQSGTCVLLDDATTICGGNGNFRAGGPDNAIAIGVERTGGLCSVLAGGTIQCRQNYCLESSYYHCASDGSFSLGVPAVAVTSNGTDFACALLADGNVKCWGANLEMPPASWLGAGIEFTQTDGGIAYGAWHPVDLGTH